MIRYFIILYNMKISAWKNPGNSSVSIMLPLNMIFIFKPWYKLAKWTATSIYLPSAILFTLYLQINFGLKTWGSISRLGSKLAALPRGFTRSAKTTKFLTPRSVQNCWQIMTQQVIYNFLSTEMAIS